MCVCCVLVCDGVTVGSVCVCVCVRMRGIHQVRPASCDMHALCMFCSAGHLKVSASINHAHNVQAHNMLLHA